MRAWWRRGRWARQVAPKASILLYYRVDEVPTDPQLLCGSPQHFAEHLEVLRRYYHPLSLRSLRRRLALNLWPPRSVVVTFDDGYADNLHQARPLLEAADVPATVFVVAGKVDSQQEFWWDELERVLLSTPELPEQLVLSINGQVYRWALPHDESNQAANQGWHVLLNNDTIPRQAAYHQLTELFHGMVSSAREDLLAQLLSWAGLEPVGRPDHRALTDDELQALAAGGLVEIGAHTMTHPVLSTLPLESQRTEIIGSKQKLEAVPGQPVTCFA